MFGHGIVTMKGTHSMVYILAENPKLQVKRLFVFNAVEYLLDLHDRDRVTI
jgi:hypothetical protein